jgi:hypothetical protein
VFNKAVVPTISTDTLYYNGEDQSPIWFNYDKSLVTMEGSLSGVAAGTYTTTFTPKSPYRWKDGTSREVNVNWTIEKSNSSVSIDNDSVQLNRNILSQEVILTKVGDGDVDIKNSNANVANVSYDGRNILTITTNGRTDGTSTITISLNEDDNYEASEPVTIVVTAKYSTIVSWADGNDDDIDLMLSNHYDGFIDVSDYWAIGDTRKINLNTIPIISTDEENPAQEIELTIIGFKHDTLKNPINGKNRAAITVQVKNCLNTAGYMNSSSDDVTIWSNCNRREWCNSEFKNALPEYLFNLVKSVVKYSNRGCHSDFEGYETYRVHEETVDDVFMLSEWEVYGNEGFIPTYSNYYGDLVADGTQYEYLAMTTSRTKTVDSAEATWWSRTSIVKSDGKSDYLGILPDGSYTQNDADIKQGLAPAFCL